MRVPLVALSLIAALGGCEHRGNLRSAADYKAPPAPKVAQPWYDPYAAYGEANVRWNPTLADRRGTIVVPGGSRVRQDASPAAMAGTF